MPRKSTRKRGPNGVMNPKMKRFFRTLYYGHDGTCTGWGTAATLRGAVRATVVRIYDEEHAYAEVIDRRNGVTHHTIEVVNGALRVGYGSSRARRR